GVGIARGRLSLSLEAQLYFPSAAESPRGGGVRATLFRGLAAPCFAIPPFALCATAAAGRLHGVSYDLPLPDEGAFPYLSAGGRVRLDLSLGQHIGIRLQGDIEVPLLQTKLTIDDEVVFRAAPLAGSTAALVRLDFN